MEKAGREREGERGRSRRSTGSPWRLDTEAVPDTLLLLLLQRGRLCGRGQGVRGVLPAAPPLPSPTVNMHEHV